MNGVNPPKKPQTPLEQACARLKAAGLRITQPRVSILNALIKRNAPASIEQLHADLAETACDLVTVYRCLAAFESLGLVRRCYFHNGTSLYQIALTGEAVYHVVCRDNGEVHELDAETMADIRTSMKRIEDALRAKGYSNVTHMAEFFAVSPGGSKDTPATI
jgi:Fur family transcriptional regulator, ferric uptake regulator